MIKGSSFNVFLEPDEKYAVKLFNTATRKSFRSRLPWEELLSAIEMYQDVGQKLLEIGILTTAESYEKEIEQYYQNRVAEERAAALVCFTVTTECNLDCSYCYQRHLIRQPTTHDVINRFMSLLERFFRERPEMRRFDFILSGGDALIRPDLCCLLLSLASKMCSDLSIKFHSLMAINGFETDEFTLQSLKDSGLHSMQISFDGPKKQHDQKREGTFDRQLANLPVFARRFRLNIKYNISRSNCEPEQFALFLDDITEKLPDGGFDIILEAIQPTMTCGPQESEYFDINSVDLADRLVRLSQMTGERGIPQSLGTVFNPPCMFTRENSLLIQPDGVLSNCVSAYDIPEFTLGNVFNIETLPFGRSYIRDQIENAASEKCLERVCSYFPLCETGCFYEKYRLGKSFKKLLCREAYVRRFFPFLYDYYRAKE